MLGMKKNAKYFVSALVGGAIAYLIASRLDTDSFAMKMFAMVVLTAAFSTTIRVFCERMFPSED
jgi:hypothetical protein